MRIQSVHRKAPQEILLFEEKSTPADKRLWRQRILDRFNEHLAEKILKLTHQRRIILDHLLGASRHLRQQEIFEALKKQDPTLGMATVFRTLKLLETCGIVDAIIGKNGKTYYEVKFARPHHDHAICIECGGIEEFSSPEMEEFQDAAVGKLGFAPLWHRHEVFGRCRSCALKG